MSDFKKLTPREVAALPAVQRQAYIKAFVASMSADEIRRAHDNLMRFLGPECDEPAQRDESEEGKRNG